MTVKNVRFTWYRLSNITVYSFHIYIADIFCGFSDFHPVKASPGFGDPMSNHAPEACMAQANSQIGGTIGDGRNERVCFDLAAASAHDDTTCVRIMTESGIMLRGHWLVSAITSKSFSECYARNLRPETWRWWLSECLRKHLFFVPSTGKRWPVYSSPPEAL